MSRADDGIFDDPVEEQEPDTKSLTTYTGLGRHRPNGLAATSQTTASSWDALFAPVSVSKLPSWLGSSSSSPTGASKAEENPSRVAHGSAGRHPGAREIGQSHGMTTKAPPPALGQSGNPITLEVSRWGRERMVSTSGHPGLPMRMGSRFVENGGGRGRLFAAEQKIGLAPTEREKLGRQPDRTGDFAPGKLISDTSSAKKRPHHDSARRSRDDEDEVEVIGVRSTAPVLNPAAQQLQQKAPVAYAPAATGLRPLTHTGRSNHTIPPTSVQTQPCLVPTSTRQSAASSNNFEQRLKSTHVTAPPAHQKAAAPSASNGVSTQPSPRVLRASMLPQGAGVPLHVQPQSRTHPNAAQGAQSLSPSARSPCLGSQGRANVLSHRHQQYARQPPNDSSVARRPALISTVAENATKPNAGVLGAPTGHRTAQASGGQVMITRVPAVGTSQGTGGVSFHRVHTAASLDQGAQNRSGIRLSPTNPKGLEPLSRSALTSEGRTSLSAQQQQPQQHQPRQPPEDPNMARRPAAMSATAENSSQPNADGLGAAQLSGGQVVVTRVPVVATNQDAGSVSFHTVQAIAAPNQGGQHGSFGIHFVSHPPPTNTAAESTTATSAVPGVSMASQVSRAALTAVNVTQGGVVASVPTILPGNGTSAQSTTNSVGAGVALLQSSPAAASNVPRQVVQRGVVPVLIAPRPPQNCATVPNAAANATRPNHPETGGSVASVPKVNRGIRHDVSGPAAQHPPNAFAGETLASSRQGTDARASQVSATVLLVAREGGGNVAVGVQGPHGSAVSHPTPSQPQNVTLAKTPASEVGGGGTSSHQSQATPSGSRAVPNPLQRIGVGAVEVPNPLQRMGAGVMRSTISQPHSVAPPKIARSDMGGDGTSSHLSQVPAPSSWSVPNPLLRSGLRSDTVLPVPPHRPEKNHAASTGSGNASSQSPQGAAQGIVNGTAQPGLVVAQGSGTPLHATATAPSSVSGNEPKSSRSTGSVAPVETAPAAPAPTVRNPMPYVRRITMLQESCQVSRITPPNSNQVEKSMTSDVGGGAFAMQPCKPSEGKQKNSDLCGESSIVSENATQTETSRASHSTTGGIASDVQQATLIPEKKASAVGSPLILLPDAIENGKVNSGQSTERSEVFLSPASGQHPPQNVGGSVRGLQDGSSGGCLASEVRKAVDRFGGAVSEGEPRVPVPHAHPMPGLKSVVTESPPQEQMDSSSQQPADGFPSSSSTETANDSGSGSHGYQRPSARALGVGSEATGRRGSPATDSNKSTNSQASKPPAQLAPGRSSGMGGIKHTIVHQLLLPKFVPSPAPTSMEHFPTADRERGTMSAHSESVQRQPHPCSDSMSSGARSPAVLDKSSEAVLLQTNQPSAASTIRRGYSEQSNPPQTAGRAAPSGASSTSSTEKSSTTANGSLEGQIISSQQSSAEQTVGKTAPSEALSPVPLTEKSQTGSVGAQSLSLVDNKPNLHTPKHASKEPTTGRSLASSASSATSDCGRIPGAKRKREVTVGTYHNEDEKQLDVQSVTQDPDPFCGNASRDESRTVKKLRHSNLGENEGEIEPRARSVGKATEREECDSVQCQDLSDPKDLVVGHKGSAVDPFITGKSIVAAVKQAESLASTDAGSPEILPSVSGEPKVETEHQGVSAYDAGQIRRQDVDTGGSEALWSEPKCGKIRCDTSVATDMGGIMGEKEPSDVFAQAGKVDGLPTCRNKRIPDSTGAKLLGSDGQQKRMKVNHNATGDSIGKPEMLSESLDEEKPDSIGPATERKREGEQGPPEKLPLSKGSSFGCDPGNGANSFDGEERMGELVNVDETSLTTATETDSVEGGPSISLTSSIPHCSEAETENRLPAVCMDTSEEDGMDKSVAPVARDAAKDEESAGDLIGNDIKDTNTRMEGAKADGGSFSVETTALSGYRKAALSIGVDSVSKHVLSANDALETDVSITVVAKSQVLSDEAESGQDEDRKEGTTTADKVTQMELSAAVGATTQELVGDAEKAKDVDVRKDTPVDEATRMEVSVTTQDSVSAGKEAQDIIVRKDLPPADDAMEVTLDAMTQHSVVAGKEVQDIVVREDITTGEATHVQVSGLVLEGVKSVSATSVMDPHRNVEVIGNTFSAHMARTASAGEFAQNTSTHASSIFDEGELSGKAVGNDGVGGIPTSRVKEHEDERASSLSNTKSNGEADTCGDVDACDVVGTNNVKYTVDGDEVVESDAVARSVIRDACDEREASQSEGWHGHSVCHDAMESSSDCVASTRSSFEERESVRQVVPSSFFESDDESLEGFAVSSGHDDLLVCRPDEETVAIAALTVDGSLLQSSFDESGVKIALQLEGSRLVSFRAPADNVVEGHESFQIERESMGFIVDGACELEQRTEASVGEQASEECRPSNVQRAGRFGTTARPPESIGTKRSSGESREVSRRAKTVLEDSKGVFVGKEKVCVDPPLESKQMERNVTIPTRVAEPAMDKDESCEQVSEATKVAVSSRTEPESDVKAKRGKRQRRKGAKKTSATKNQPVNPTGKRGDATHFPRTLYKMLEEQTEMESELVSWDADGRSFTAVTTGENSVFFDVVKTYFPQWKYPRDAFHQQLRFRGFVREFVACEGRDELGREKIRRRYKLENFYRGMSVEELETKVLNVPARKRPEWDGTRKPRRNAGAQVESDQEEGNGAEQEVESREKPSPPSWKEPTFYSRALYRMVSEQTEKECPFCFWSDDGKSFTTKTTGHHCEFFDIVRHYFPQWKSPRNSFFDQLRCRGFDRENLGSEFPNGETKSGARLEVRRFTHPHFYRGMSVEELDANVVLLPTEEKPEWDTGRRYYRAGETVPSNKVEKDETGISTGFQTYFPRRVYYMLEEETKKKNKLISWDPDGRSFFVVTTGHRSTVFSVVKRYFPHWKCPRNSFRDQLRFRGFVREMGKVDGTIKAGKGGSQPVLQRFRHPYFYRGVTSEELDRHISVVPKELRPVWFEAKRPRSCTLDEILSADKDARAFMNLQDMEVEDDGDEDENMEESSEEEEEEEMEEEEEEQDLMPEIKVARRKPERQAI